MPVFCDRIENYIDEHCSSVPDVLHQLERYTHLNTAFPNMLTGKIQGNFLSMVSQMVRPEKILEIGAFTGYSAICLAAGLKENGIIHTIEINPEYILIAEKFIEKSGLTHAINIHEGDARQLIPKLDDEFDLIFIDANKEHYSEYYEMAIEKLKRNGHILADNALWGGKVVDAKPDSETRALIDFNKKVQSDQRVQNVLLSIRDGLMLIRKL